MLQPYRAILARPGAAAFSAAGAIARLPMSMVGIGIVLMVSEVYGSYGLAGRISAVQVITHALCSPQLSRLVDRFGQARVMRPALVVTAVGIVGLIVPTLLEASPLYLYAAAVVTGAAGGSVGALVRARWSHLLQDPREIHSAYSLESALDELVFIVGPVLATVLATSVSPVAGLVVPVVAVLVGGTWFFSQRATEPPVVVREEGVHHPFVLRSGGMVVLAVVFVFMGAIFGATDVATVAFAEEQGNKGAAGLILAVFAAGSLLAGLGYGARHWTSPLWRRFAIGMVALAVGVTLFFFVTNLAVLAAVMFVVGLTIAPTIINGNALVQQLVPRGQLTEGLTWVGTALGVGVSFGSSIAGARIDAAGSHAGFLVVVVSGGLAVVAVLAASGTLRRGEARYVARTAASATD
ncbi:MULTISPECIES: MFS transporter [unclassified Actinotalea]|uniref:MFS transporter n=1 Tax=unclassified Actinotalea TaxID=2638618 RepID=UPI0015F41B5C|nr:MULTISPECIES: MFS transporter [unclassified Actinotalea]